MRLRNYESLYCPSSISGMKTRHNTRAARRPRRRRSVAIVPDTRIGKIEFYEAHLPPWSTNAVAIGLTAAKMTAFADLVKNARSAYDSH